MEGKGKQSAFSSRSIIDLANGETKGEGITVRDYFAAKAMQSMAGSNNSIDWICEKSYQYADAMLTQREK